MIKVKVKDKKATTRVEGEIRDLVVEAGCVIWALKDLIKTEHIMPEEDVNTYLAAFALGDNQKDVTKILRSTILDPAKGADEND
jgi:hypothetical protein